MLKEFYYQTQFFGGKAHHNHDLTRDLKIENIQTANASLALIILLQETLKFHKDSSAVTTDCKLCVLAHCEDLNQINAAVDVHRLGEDQFLEGDDHL